MYSYIKLKFAWPPVLPDRGVCLNGVRPFPVPFCQRGSRCAAARGGLSKLSARFFCSLQVENGPLHDSTVSASAKARPTEGATLHARLRLGYGQHQVMAQESVDDWYSIRPSTELGENLDGARRLSRLAQFSRFTHKPRRPGDYRLHHVTTSRTHSVLQRPQQASATRGLLVVTGCAAVSFTQKA